jgi:hypothetical protein
LKPLGILFAPAPVKSLLDLADFESLPYLDVITMAASAATHRELK